MINNKYIGYFPQLNALRALAVAMTLFAHFQGPVGLYKIPYLWLGVDIFFTISGFLITGILLKSAEKSGGSFFPVLYNFIVRRILRLFPAYYLLIIVFWAARNFGHLYIWENDFNPYFFLYAPNWFFFYYQQKASGSFNHLWSLGVEEQFYFVWPWIILFFNRKHIKVILLSTIAISLLCNFLFQSYSNFRMLPFANLHTLGSGGLLAYYFFTDQDNKTFKLIFRNSGKIFFVSFFTLVFFLFYTNDLKIAWVNLAFAFLVAVTSLMLVTSAAKGIDGVCGYFFNNSLTNRIGKISYGVYLYHMPVPATLTAIGSYAGVKLDYAQHPLFYLFVFILITLIVADLSYRYIETPFLNLKDSITERSFIKINNA